MLFQLGTSGIRKAKHPTRKMTLPVRPRKLLLSRLCIMKKMAHTRNKSQPIRWSRFSPLAIFEHLRNSFGI